MIFPDEQTVAQLLDTVFGNEEDQRLMLFTGPPPETADDLLDPDGNEHLVTMTVDQRARTGNPVTQGEEVRVNAFADCKHFINLESGTFWRYMVGSQCVAQFDADEIPIDRKYMVSGDTLRTEIHWEVPPGYTG